MSAARCWWWLPALLWGGAGGYVVLSSVSWPLPEAGGAADELHSSSTEEALPGLLEEAGGIWKQSFPASAYREDAALGPGASARRSEQGAAPSRMFSYRRQPAAPPGRAATARRLARHGAWGFVASRAAHGKIQGMPYGNLLPVSDGPVNNSTGIPFFYVTLKDNAVADLLKDPVASLTLPESDGNFCRKNVVDPEDPRCARLTLTGQMVTVPPEETEFAKQAIFSRHPVIRKWPRSYEWFFMKMNIEHVWLQSWYGGVSTIAVEEYLKAVPSKA
ncbi:protein CREG2 [Tympanuchus pallidicinctus]|uniref:protein CREG2 n=1 Tax=Lagopus leucura TaxID=30410 RepID=UPI001C66F79B|nr:protein CREG2 [Lagopus leucura]XP_048823937.1 protein CREG2 isoform X1 [Lagopus muta]XP_052520872.1 protein CREG2 [Tympanuchus pallidicinctus]